MNPSIIGLDIAKRCFQVHGIDADGEVILARALTRARLLPFFSGLAPCLIGIEACATAHHWARELRALGHEVRLIPPAYVKPYVRRNKSDAKDAAAIWRTIDPPSSPRFRSSPNTLVASGTILGGMCVVAPTPPHPRKFPGRNLR